jgi:hypothetical protein
MSCFHVLGQFILKYVECSNEMTGCLAKNVMAERLGILFRRVRLMARTLLDGNHVVNLDSVGYLIKQVLIIAADQN